MLLRRGRVRMATRGDWLASLPDRGVNLLAFLSGDTEKSDSSRLTSTLIEGLLSTSCEHHTVCCSLSCSRTTRHTTHDTAHAVGLMRREITRGEREPKRKEGYVCVLEW